MQRKKEKILFLEKSKHNSDKEPLMAEHGAAATPPRHRAGLSGF